MVHPNPARGDKIFISGELLPGRYQLEGISTGGVVVFNHHFRHSGGRLQPLPLPSCPPGLYVLKLTGAEPISLKILVQ
jgi:hypothetical protein